MKHKLSSMGRVALALVLALSLTLVMAVPVAATHTSSAVVDFQALASTVAGEASILDVVVTNGSSGCAINTVKIDFSESDFTVTGPGAEVTDWTGSIDGDVVTYTADNGGIALDGNETFSPAVTNPQIFGEATVPAVLTTDVGSQAELPAGVNTEWIGYVADSVGVSGNGITVEYVNPYDVSQDLSINVVGSAITVSLETDDGGILTSTAPDVATAINDDANAGALVDATVEAGHEADVLTAETTVPAFTGGVSPNVDKASTVTPETLTVTSIVPDSFAVVAGAANIVTAGEAFSVEIIALQEGGETTETKYAGDHLIDFTYGGDPTGTLPGFEVITFINGVGTSSANFILTLATEDDNTITATDNQLTAVATGTSDPIIINLPALDYFEITDAPASVTAGAVFGTDVTVTAYDSLDNVKTDYVGTVSWTSSDPLAELPDAHALVEGEWTFTAADFTLKTVLLEDGSPIDTTITATGDGVPVDESITVEPAAASEITVTAAPTSIRADGTNESTITATAYDEFSNATTGLTGGAGFIASLGTLSSATATFSDGVATVTLTSTAVGTATVKLTDRDATVTIVNYEEIAGDMVTVTIDGTAHELTEGDGWDAEVNNATTATNLTGVIHALDGVTASSDGAVVTITAGEGCAITALTTTSDADGMTVTPSLPYDTTTVSLVATSLLAEVWVDATDGDDGNAGTESSPVETIQKGIDIAAEGGTVTVAGGTYTPAATATIVIVVNKELTLQAAVGSTPVIEADRDGVSSYHVIVIAANNVTIDGFTIVEDGAAVASDWGIYVVGDHENFVIQNNTVTGFEDEYDVGIRVMSTILTESTSGLIKDNTVEASYNGIEISNVQYVTIQGNLVQNNDGDGIALFSASSDITVIENKVYSNAGGLFVTVGSSGVFHHNDIVGNVDWYGLKYEGTVPIDAENNWWGNASGPTHVSNPDGTGDTVGITTYFVDYTPWLGEAYAEPADPVLPVTTIDLVAGWNLISLTLIPEDNDIVAMTASLTECLKIRRYVPGATSPDDWPVYNYGSPGASTLLTMEDGYGYWIKMEDPGTGGSFTFDGWELVAETDPPSVPPSYDVVEGWNLIGFKSTTSSGIATYLGGVSEILDAIYGYQDGAFFIPTELEPGLGYWIAVTDPGTIYP